MVSTRDLLALQICIPLDHQDVGWRSETRPDDDQWSISKYLCLRFTSVHAHVGIRLGFLLVQQTNSCNSNKPSSHDEFRKFCDI